MNGIGIITYHNNYETNDYFSHRLAEAFIRKNKNVAFTTVPMLANPLGPAKTFLQHSLINLSCSFGLAGPLDRMKDIWKQAPLPHLHILIDPLAYSMYELNHPNIIVSTIDQTDYEYARQLGLKNVIFLPHGIEKSLYAEPDQPRPYDVTFLATCYDPDAPDICKLIETGIKISQCNPELSYWKVIEMALEQVSVDPKELKWDNVYASIDYYIRGLDRLALIRSIKDAEVHVFGGAVLYYQKDIKGWGHYLSDQANVVIHPSIPFGDALEVMKQSKICLNSVPMYKGGSHERIFASLACGAVPITTDNAYVRKEFIVGEELLVYRTNEIELVNSMVNDLLANEDKRRAMADKGRKKVMAAHTWDHRVDQLLKELPPILEKIANSQTGGLQL